MVAMLFGSGGLAGYACGAGLACEYVEWMECGVVVVWWLGNGI
jgi:hypothetical protein